MQTFPTNHNTLEERIRKEVEEQIRKEVEERIRKEVEERTKEKALQRIAEEINKRLGDAVPTSFQTEFAANGTLTVTADGDRELVLPGCSQCFTAVTDYSRENKAKHYKGSLWFEGNRSHVSVSFVDVPEVALDGELLCPEMYGTDEAGNRYLLPVEEWSA